MELYSHQNVGEYLKKILTSSTEYLLSFKALKQKTKIRSNVFLSVIMPKNKSLDVQLSDRRCRRIETKKIHSPKNVCKYFNIVRIIFYGMLSYHQNDDIFLVFDDVRTKTYRFCQKRRKKVKPKNIFGYEIQSMYDEDINKEDSKIQILCQSKKKCINHHISLEIRIYFLLSQCFACVLIRNSFYLD